jgi:hypothetical protein
MLCGRIVAACIIPKQISPNPDVLIEQSSKSKVLKRLTRGLIVQAVV